MQPRWYQSQAVQAAWDYIRASTGNPALVLPTGAGKSLVIAMLASDTVAWGGRSIILAHRKELLEQNAAKVAACAPGLQVGLYSAGLGAKDYSATVVCAGIQSCFKQVPAYNIGHRDTIIVDEAHLIPAKDSGMYREFLGHMQRINPHVRVIGLTATPYRLDSGLVCGEENILTEIAYEVPLERLIGEGYLSKLTSKDPTNKIDTAGIHTRAGEFIQSELDQSASVPEVVRKAMEELLAWTQDRKSTLVFCCGRKHLLACLEVLQGYGVSVAMVDGTTPSGERAKTLEAFQKGQVKYLLNIDVLTTGFDAPNVDCVTLLRPTMSPGLYYQMVGRGFRLAPGKLNCLVLDFAGNVMRHGPLDRLNGPKPKSASGSGTPGEQPAKACPQCKELLSISVRECPACGYHWPEKDPSHDSQASCVPVLSGQVPRVTVETLPVLKTDYIVHKSERGPRMFRAIHKVQGLKDTVSEYICLEHLPGSWAWKKAKEWWEKHTDWPFPQDGCWGAYHAQRQFQILTETKTITIKRIPGGKHPEVIGTELGEKPAVSYQELQDHEDLVQKLKSIFGRRKHGQASTMHDDTTPTEATSDIPDTGL